jgi:hypothetical protein
MFFPLDGRQGFLRQLQCCARFELKGCQASLGNDLGDFVGSLLRRDHRGFGFSDAHSLSVPILSHRAS